MLLLSNCFLSRVSDRHSYSVVVNQLAEQLVCRAPDSTSLSLSLNYIKFNSLIQTNPCKGFSDAKHAAGFP